MTDACMLSYRQRTNLLKFAMFLLMALAIGLLAYLAWDRNERWAQAESKCVPGLVERIQGNQVLCTTGEKRWVTNIR